MLLMSGVKRKDCHLTSIELNVFMKAARAPSCDMSHTIACNSNYIPQVLTCNWAIKVAGFQK